MGYCVLVRCVVVAQRRALEGADVADVGVGVAALGTSARKVVTSVDSVSACQCITRERRYTGRQVSELDFQLCDATRSYSGHRLSTTIRLRPLGQVY
jgi:hypothetical protein